MHIRRVAIVVIVVAIAAMMCAPSFATLLPNGDFELQGAGWEFVTNITVGTGFNGYTGSYAYAGSYGAGFGENKDNPPFGYQGTTTLQRQNPFSIGVGDTVDFYYNLQKDVTTGPGSTDTFTAKLSGAADLQLLSLGLGSADTVWHHYTSAALTASDMQTLFGNNVGGLGNIRFTVTGDGQGASAEPVMWVYIDNVSHDTPPNGTPELGTFALLGMSMLPMAGVAIRRRRKSA